MVVVAQKMRKIVSRRSPVAIAANTGGRAVLAPLSGVTDLGMRRAAQAFGAAFVVSEMVAADALVASDEEARLRAEGAGLHPHIVQIAGRCPLTLADAARVACASGADAIDINMGCPAKRVVGGLAGAALMREPDLATALVHAVVAAVDVPVSVKMRLGWDESSRNAPELARRFEAEGVAWLTVHGRTRTQFYTGCADWAAIRIVRAATSLPVIANGDCHGADDARTMLAASGADAVMIGRAAVGQPWLVGIVDAFLRGEHALWPDAASRRAAALAQYETLLATMGLAGGVRHARKHLVAYARCAVADGFLVDEAARRRLATSDCHREVSRVLGRLWDAPAVAPAKLAA